jgi:hypothetical protein
MKAGTKVSAQIMVTTTTSAAARPSAPTKPSPSSVAMVGAVVGNVITLASSASSASPASTLKIADSSGIAAAISDQNMIRSSTSAQASPMTSDFMSLAF